MNLVFIFIVLLLDRIKTTSLYPSSCALVVKSTDLKWQDHPSYNRRCGLNVLKANTYIRMTT